VATIEKILYDKLNYTFIQLKKGLKMLFHLCVLCKGITSKIQVA